MKTGFVCWIVGICCLYFSFLHLFGLSMDSDFGFWIAMLPLILYVCYMIVTKKWNAIYWEKRQVFVILAVVLGIELLISLISGKDVVAILMYAMAYLLLSFIALNIFRFGHSIDRKGKILYVLHIGAYVIVCGMSAVIIKGLRGVVGRILEIIFMPFGMLLAALVSLGSRITAMLSNKVEELEVATEKIEEQITQNQQAVIEQNIATDAGGEVSVWLMQAGVTVAVILLLVYIIYRIYHFYHGRSVRMEEVPEYVGTVEAVGRKSFGKINLFKTNREKIRKEYAKHMRMIRIKGCRISKSSTSLDICNEAKARLEFGAQTEERIRALYMKARYTEEIITDEEVKEMRQLVSNAR